MNFPQIVTYAALVLFAVAAPYWSILAFVVLSPWSAVHGLIGWDPRVSWSFLLALRASLESLLSKSFHFPRSATWSFWTFALLAILGLQFGTEKVPDAELRSAWIMFLYFLSGAFAGFAIIKLAHDRKKLSRLAIAAALSILVASGVGLLQAAILYSAGEASVRIPGTLDNPNYFAAYLSIAATIMALFARLHVLNRVLALTACLVACVTCLLTFSRMGTVACLVGVTLALFLKRAGRLFDVRLLAAASAVTVIGFGLALGYLAEVRRSLTFSADPGQAEMASMIQEAEDLSRLEAVQFAWRTFEQHPVLGVGINTLAARNQKVKGMYVTTHDTYMQVLAGTGIAGFLLMATIVISLGKSLPRETRRYLLPFFAVLCLCSFFGDFLQSIDIFVLFAILFAALRQHDAKGDLQLEGLGAS